MKRRSLIVILCAAGLLPTQELPSYRAEEKVTGTIRVWGDENMAVLLKAWSEGFRKRQPGVAFETKLKGTVTGVAGLYTGVADIALMGRDIWTAETMGFTWVLKHPPVGIEVTTGTFEARNKTVAQVIFVHRDNPISKMTLTEVDSIFGGEHLRGPRNSRTWDQLGLTGEWTGKPIHPYGFVLDSGLAIFFQQAVLK